MTNDQSPDKINRLNALFAEIDDLRMQLDDKIEAGDEVGVQRLLSRLRLLVAEIDRLGNGPAREEE